MRVRCARCNKLASDGYPCANCGHDNGAAGRGAEGMQTEKAVLHHQIEVVRRQLDELVMRQVAIDTMPADTYPAGEVIQFKMTFPGTSIAYTYVAVKVDDPPHAARPWWLSSARGAWLTWEELWGKLTGRFVSDAWWASSWEPVEGLGG